MASLTVQRSRELWTRASKQHNVVSHEHLLEMGYTATAIKHRVAKGRLHRIYRGVYAVGRPDVTEHGEWMAAVLVCGEGAALSDDSAGALWGIWSAHAAVVHVTVPPARAVRQQGIRVHRRRLAKGDRTRRHGIPVTSLVFTLIDLAARHPRGAVERAINEADRLDLINPEQLRAALDEAVPCRPGVGRLRAMLDRRTFVLTESALERRFLPIVKAARLPLPQTKRRVSQFKTDFFWPDLGLIVETDGLRYHRTPAQQARDRVRDQRHTAAGLTTLRFTHEQVRYAPDHVREILTRVAARLRAAA